MFDVSPCPPFATNMLPFPSLDSKQWTTTAQKVESIVLVFLFFFAVIFLLATGYMLFGNNPTSNWFESPIISPIKSPL